MPASNTEYLKFEANEIADFLKAKLGESGQFTDQLYAGSNITTILETLSAMMEMFLYQLNFQATEATFNGVQVYENMLKIVSPLGYNARASVAPTIIGQLTAFINIKNFLQDISLSQYDNGTTVSELVTDINEKLNIISNSKVLTRDLVFTNPSKTATYSILETSSVYPEFINLSMENIFYWRESGSTAAEGILGYLNYIWNPSSQITGNTLLSQLSDLIGKQLSELSLTPDGIETVPCNLRISSNDIDNFVTFINGQWTTTYITSNTIGEVYEKYNISSINVNDTNISDGSLFVVEYDPSDNPENGRPYGNSVIYKSVSSLRNYGASDKVFEYKVDVDKTITITFGDGVYGSKLNPNKSLALFYIVNNGAGGEIAKSGFTNNRAQIGSNNVVQDSIDGSISSFADFEKVFLFNNLDTTKISPDNCNIISYLLLGQQNNYQPEMEVFFVPSSSSSKYQPIETVSYIRNIAPRYNRTNDRLITKNDVYTMLKKDFIQYVYDLLVMDNFEYMATFYNWLYKYDRLSKDVASSGYKFADSCNFNDIYVWLKSYTNYPVNDFIKKTIEKNLNPKKPLTAELVFLDTLTTYFYPYIGRIDEDIDWLLEAATKYSFLIRQYNTSDRNYVKWNNIISLFDKDKNGAVIKKPTKKFLSYLFSSENKELRIKVQGFRDQNLNENESTVKSNIANAINKYFKIENRKLGDNVKLNELNQEISNIAGLKRISTIKEKNIAIYSNSIPRIYAPVVSNSGTKYEVTFNQNNTSGVNDKLSFTLDTTLLDGNDNPLEDVTIQWFILDISNPNAQPRELVSINKPKDAEDNEIRVKLLYNSTSSDYSNEIKASINNALANPEFYLYSESESTDANTNNTILRTKGNIIDDPTHVYALYAQFSRFDKKLNQTLTSQSNKIQFYFGLVESEIPATFRLNSVIDNNSNLSLILESEIASSSYETGKDIWQISDSMSTLAFACWTNQLIEAKDFQNIGSGHITIEPFCFPSLYKNIEEIIEIKQDETDTISLEY